MSTPQNKQYKKTKNNILQNTSLKIETNETHPD